MDAEPEDEVDVGVDAGVSAEAAAAAEVVGDLDSLLRERDELLDTSRRLQADFENYRKRVLREQTAVVERSTERLVEQLLPVLDSFELAVMNLEGEQADLVKVRKGVDLVYAELLAVLEKAGLNRIEGPGVPFDPTEHEAVLHDEGDGEPVVSDVMRTGWRLKGRVLRPAMVKVTKSGASGGGAGSSAHGGPAPAG
ncbi:MAG: nucleotide exchange factor GrpE [Acidimicrobiia bacterium]|nr:nucleotide exchange factor GrpE [Acidimicrobiia bacterium]